jgi:hypothetical protein
MTSGIFPSTRWDIGMVCEFMRESDIDEVTQLAVQKGKNIASWSFKEDMFKAFEGNGEFWTIWIDDSIVGIGGLVPTHVDKGLIWFLGTDLADSQWRTMTRQCKKMKTIWEANGWSTYNIAPLNQERRLLWLQYLGFDIEMQKANDPFKGYVLFQSQSPYPAPQRLTAAP